MALFDGSDDGSNGLMGMFANPQTAGLLGMAQGLLASSGPSRIPVTMGQAMGQGLSGMQQGVGNAFATQQQLMRMQALQGLMGAGAQGSGQGGSAQPAPQITPSTPVTGGANTAGMSGLMAGMGSIAPSTGAAASSAASAYPATAGGGAGGLLFGRTPQQLWQQGMAMNLAGIQGGGDLMKLAAQYDPTLQAQMPTDITKMATQAGMSPTQIQSANAAGVQKANALSIRPGGGVMVGNQFVMTPGQAPAGYMNVQDPNSPSGWSTVPVAGGLAAVGNSAAAKAGGEGSVLPYAGVDNQGNPLPVTNRTAAATQGSNVPLPMRNNNPGALSQNGQVASYPDLQTGLAKMDQNLASYAGQKDAGTLGQVITKWVGSPPNAPAYINDVTSRLGVGANTPVDLTNPAQRQAIATAIMLHENGPAAVFANGGGAQQPAGATSAAAATQPAQSGQIYASAPMNAQTFATGQTNQMLARWNTLRDQNTSAQTVVSQLQNISALAPAAITGAEQDRRAYMNGLLSLVGVPSAQDSKTATDLLDKYSNQIIAKLGQGGLGTDAARSIVSAGNPNAHMTVPAIQEAVRNLTGQYQMTQAKASLLQPYATGNDSAGYSKAETTFDQNADPRIWEWQSIQDPAARQKFAAGVLQQDPKFGQKIQSLEQLGVLQ